jgi:hypothetical protein
VINQRRDQACEIDWREAWRGNRCATIDYLFDGRGWRCSIEKRRGAKRMQAMPRKPRLAESDSTRAFDVL